MSKDILYLGSQSQSRRKLLEETGFSFKILDHKSDEESVPVRENFYEYVQAIALHKMDCVVLPEHSEQTGDILFVLTADTLVRTKDTHHVFGKPRDREHAKEMLRMYRDELAEIVTGCCLEKKVWLDGAWTSDASKQWTTVSFVELHIDEDDLETFLHGAPHSLKAAGSAIIELYGQNFCKAIQGSYSSIIGLPMFELRCELKKLEFRF